jgi:hypothetical protein
LMDVDGSDEEDEVSSSRRCCGVRQVQCGVWECCTCGKPVNNRC